MSVKLGSKRKKKRKAGTATVEPVSFHLNCRTDFIAFVLAFLLCLILYPAETSKSLNFQRWRREKSVWVECCDEIFCGFVVAFSHWFTMPINTTNRTQIWATHLSRAAEEDAPLASSSNSSSSCPNWSVASGFGGACVGVSVSLLLLLSLSVLLFVGLSKVAKRPTRGNRSRQHRLTVCT